MGASFNLSILECKYHIQVHNQLQIHTFNLSILECKCYYETAQTSMAQLLISPYWNVNLVKVLLVWQTIRLLISPYWNVNASRQNRGGIILKLLISPYWNVNVITIIGACSGIGF